MPTRYEMSIGIVDVDEEFIASLREWKEYINRSQANISDSERKNMKSVDCIEWFCSLLRSRLEEWKKEGRLNTLLNSEAYIVRKGCLIGDKND